MRIPSIDRGHARLRPTMQLHDLYNHVVRAGAGGSSRARCRWGATATATASYLHAAHNVAAVQYRYGTYTCTLRTYVRGALEPIRKVYGATGSLPYVVSYISESLRPFGQVEA